MKIKFFPKGKSCYCFIPPTLLWRRYFIKALKVVDVLFSCFFTCSRASKAFTNQQALKDSGCGPCFTEVHLGY